LTTRDDELPGKLGQDLDSASLQESVRFPEDYALAQSVARGDPEATRAFVESYAGRILQTALNWCRSSGYRADSRLKFGTWGKLLDRVFGSDCDEVHDAFAFLLHALKHRVLPAYQGRASLKVFLYPVFKPASRLDARKNGCNYYTLYVEYVRSKRGKYVPPTWVERLSKLDQRVYRESIWGKDRWHIASLVTCEVREVEASLLRIEAAARGAGLSAYNAWLTAMTAAEVSLSAPSNDDPDSAPLERTIASRCQAPDVDAQLSESLRVLRAALAKLPAEDRKLLHLRCERNYTGAQTATDLGMDLQEVYRRERKAFGRLDDALSALSPQYVSLGFDGLREGLRGLYG
jgi:RNA polymerase sigma factor (sigma-70 family)